jgi:FkbM family methyltransferase
MHGLRMLLDRLRGRETVAEVDLLGRPVLLSIASRLEARRARSIRREKAVLARMLEHLEVRDVAYDIGANIGLVSLLLSVHRPTEGGRVHSFEPEPVNYGRLCRNIELNGLRERVAAHRLALGAEEGEAELFIRPGAGEGRHSLATARGSKGSIRVPVVTLASFAHSSGEPPDFLKVDVEGAEGQVLVGMDPLLNVRRPRELFIEIHPKGGGDRMPGGQSIGDWLHARGYALAWEGRDGSRIQRHYR